MNFFELQDEARRKTGRLILLFMAAVVLIVFAVNLTADLLFFSLFGLREMPFYTGAEKTRIHVYISLGTVLLIGLASWYRIRTLRSGGDMIAINLGAQWVDPDTREPILRRLCNVVEEISIASGVPTPHIYVLTEEKGINALAAGYSFEDAAIVVSQGALDYLNRDELQGVIAHEFTHILNGDMRLNIRMMGILFGILVISVVGRSFIHGSIVVDNGKDKGGGGILAILGFGLLLLGYIGVFFGRLIRSGVSRQREFLADASAVQFTRNPSGIAGALKKIGGLKRGSRMRMAKREEVSHMFFSSGQSFFLRMLATHPPLLDRIRAIEPGFKPESLEDYAKTPKQIVEEAPTSSFAAGTSPAWSFLSDGGAGVHIRAEDLSESMKQDAETFQERLEHAAETLLVLPEALLEAARSTDQVEALFPALLLGREKGEREERLELVRRELTETLYAKVEDLLLLTEKLHPFLILPLSDLAFSALRSLEGASKKRMVHLMKEIIRLDGEVSLFEYSFVRLLGQRLKQGGNPAETGNVVKENPANLREGLIKIFSVLAFHGHESVLFAERAFSRGISRMLPFSIPAYEAPGSWIKDLDTALEILEPLDFRMKAELIEALLDTAAYDGKLSLEEAELLRVVCASLHVPVPQVLPSV